MSPFGKAFIAGVMIFAPSIGLVAVTETFSGSCQAIFS